MTRLFLSYRRDDSAGFAGRLADGLEAEFGAGSVFRDVDDIHPGQDFVDAIRDHLRQVDAVLVMIGPRWLASSAGGQRRLDDPEDFVRREIQTALASGKPVIPVLVGGAAMPAGAELPEAIADLARRQAVVLSDAGWRDDVRHLMDALRALLPNVDAMPSPRRKLLRGLAMAGAALVVMAWSFQAWRPPPAANQPGNPVGKPAAVDIAGRWTARVTYEWGDTHDEVFDFRWSDSQLRGTSSYLTGTLVIEQGRLEGDKLSFITRSEEIMGGDRPSKHVTHRYTGRVSRDGIHFTLESSGGYSVHPPLEFVARRAPG